MYKVHIYVEQVSPAVHWTHQGWETPLSWSYLRTPSAPWDLIKVCNTEFTPTFHHRHHYLSLNREGRWGTTDDFATSFLHFPCSPLPSCTWQTPGLSIPLCCLPISSSCLLYTSDAADDC